MYPIPSNTKTSVSFVLLSLMVIAGIACAENDWALVPSVAYQQKQLNFDQQYRGETITDNDAKFSAKLPIASLGLTAAYKRIYTSIKYESNLTDSSVGTEETDRTLTNEVNLLTFPFGTIDVARRDISAVIGYNVAGRLNLFIGYLNGKTEISPDPFCADIVHEAAQQTCARTNRAALQYTIIDQNLYSGSEPSPYKQTYTENGPFIGASYNFNVANIGSVVLSLAYADMDGEYKDNAYNYDAGFRAFNYQGSTTGTSLAVTWTASLSASSTYFFDFRRQFYSMKGSDTTGTLEGVDLSTDEEMLCFTAGVQFYL